MRLPRVRLTVRRMMVAVAIAGLSLGLWRIRQHQALAEMHRSLRATAEKKLLLIDRLSRKTRMRPYFSWRPGAKKQKAFLDRWSRELDLAQQWVRYHESMAARHEHAARYPWLPIAPDPPASERAWWLGLFEKLRTAKGATAVTTGPK